MPRTLLSITVLAAALCLPAAAHAASGFTITETTGQHIDVNFKGRPVIRLMTANDLTDDKTAHNTYKVYAHVIDPLDPEAKRTITKGAGDKFTHHRGIYIGWSKTRIDGVGQFDTWHMKDGVRQIYRKILDQKASAEQAKLTVAIDWVAKDKTILTEKRTLIVHAPESNGAFTLDKISEITAVAGDTDLNGDPEHAGCQYRAHEAVVKNKSAKYVFPKGVGKVNDERDMPWAGLTYQIDGRPYHVQHMSHPSIPKGNRYSAYRDYGRFGAFFVTKIAKGDSATFRIRFHISPGGFPDNAQAVMAKRYEQYVQDAKH